MTKKVINRTVVMLEQHKTADPALVTDRLDRYAEMILAQIGKEN